jgi:hypothetical protein
MPLLRYFMYVGGALLALLLISNAVLPQVPLPDNLTSASDLPPVRIHSERKLPERVVFDTSVPVGAPTPIVKTVEAAVPAPAPMIAPPAVAEMTAKARVREAFAQLPDGGKATDAKMSRMALVALPEPRTVSKAQVQKRRIAKPRIVNPSIMVAQRPHFGPDGW